MSTLTGHRLSSSLLRHVTQITANTRTTPRAESHVFHYCQADRRSTAPAAITFHTNAAAAAAPCQAWGTLFRYASHRSPSITEAPSSRGLGDSKSNGCRYLLFSSSPGPLSRQTRRRHSSDTSNCGPTTPAKPVTSRTDASTATGSEAEELSPFSRKTGNDGAAVPRSLEDAKERTKAVADKVRSSLPKLTSHENIYNLPNFLTASRLIAAPVTAYLLLHDQHAAALGLFAYAGITDLVDGWLARRWNLQTVVGSVIDPMADKGLMIMVTVTLAIKGALPLYLATLILGRDASLAIAAIYYRYASLPAPKTFNRYWDFSLPSAEVHPTTVSKYNTFLQLVLIGSTLALPVITIASTTTGITSSIVHALGLQFLDLHAFMQYLQWTVAATTAWSGLSYAFLKNAVTILGSNEELKAKQGARGRAIIGVLYGGVVALSVWFAFTVDDQKRNARVDGDGSTEAVAAKGTPR